MSNKEARDFLNSIKDKPLTKEMEKWKMIAIEQLVKNNLIHIPKNV